MLLCYQLSDEEAQNLHQVRAHDVRAFAASKAFHGGVSLDQILSPGHWKSHNTFTQFYLSWADSELYHLGPVVAAQQIHQDKQVNLSVLHSIHFVHIKKNNFRYLHFWKTMIQSGSSVFFHLRSNFPVPLPH